MTEKIYTLDEIRSKIRSCQTLLETTYNVDKIYIFGSYARGEQTSQSDIDLLVEFKKPLGLKFFTLEKFFSDLFGKEVDLGTPDGLKPFVKEKILQEAVQL